MRKHAGVRTPPSTIVNVLKIKKISALINKVWIIFFLRDVFIDCPSSHNVDIFNKSLIPSRDHNKNFQGLKHIDCCNGKVNDDPNEYVPERLLICKTVCVARSIVRRFHFDYFKYLCQKDVKCLSKGRNIITGNNSWASAPTATLKLELVRKIDQVILTILSSLFTTFLTNSS